MKVKSILALAMTLTMGFSLGHARDLNGSDFESAHKLLAQAEQQLDATNDKEKRSAAVAELKKIVETIQKDENLVKLLSMPADKCPTVFKPDYDKAVSLKHLVEDAAKRLSMGGVMQEKEVSDTYVNLIKLVKIDNPEVTDGSAAHEGTPTAAINNREERMQWWRDGKLGVFIHYGLYSGLAGESKGKVYEGCVEWIQQQTGLDTDAYVAEAMPLFNPKTGKAEEWVKLAKENGFCYTVLTSRHHEGFNMFNTKHSDFNVYKAKGVDIIKEYAAACEKHGVKAGYYLSTIDWNHPDYDPTGSGISYPHGCYQMEKDGRRKFGNHEKYKEYLADICEDLFSQYKVDLVWWDFSQPRFQGDPAWGATRLMKLLFDNHPMAIQNNRLYHSDNHAHEGGIKVTPHWKGDYSTAEHHIPGTGIPGDWEACQTLNGSWGYSKHNQKWKQSADLIREIINTVSRGGNYLLNIGPEPDGTIPAESIVLFKEIGAWLKVNGEAIYGTRFNPLGMEMNWGRATSKGENLTYLFLFVKPEDGQIAIPVLFENPKVTLVDGGKELEVKLDKNDHSTWINIADVELDPAATVIRIEGKRIPRK